jgi:hypothetical protein
LYTLKPPCAEASRAHIRRLADASSILARATKRKKVL